jgi:hypothetical protein
VFALGVFVPVTLKYWTMTPSTVWSTVKMTDDNTPVKRAPGGQFVPGQSGNPAGRAKGTKNKITLARLLLEETLRDQLTQAGPKLMKEAIKQALKGNDRVMRVLLDKMLTTPRGGDDNESGDRDVKVVVQNLIKAPEPRKALEVDGESVKVTTTHKLPKE